MLCSESLLDSSECMTRPPWSSDLVSGHFIRLAKQVLPGMGDWKQFMSFLVQFLWKIKYQEFTFIVWNITIYVRDNNYWTSFVSSKFYALFVISKIRLYLHIDMVQRMAFNTTYFFTISSIKSFNTCKMQA